MLFGSMALEVLIGMIFIYLLLSLLCSALAEYFAALFNVRAKNLRNGIEVLLNDVGVKTDAGEDKGENKSKSEKKSEDLVQRLYSHGLIRALYPKSGKLPSYIPSRTFALALWSIATEEVAPGTTDLTKIKKIIESVPNSELRQALGILVADARNNFTRARKNIEDWYEGAMDRVSGGYKRRVQYILFGIGLVLAAAINADTINIAKVLIRDPALRSSVVAAAEAELQTPTTTAALAAAAATPSPTAAPSPEQAATPSRAQAAGSPARPQGAATPARPQQGAATPTPTPVPEDIRRLEEARERVRRVKAQLNELGLPLGWVGVQRDEKTRAITNADDLRRRPVGLMEWLLKFAGIFMTALAISQGAPFWFDLLNKFMVIRSTVKPKEKSQEQPSKDKPAPETETGDDDGNGDNGNGDDGNGGSTGGTGGGSTGVGPAGGAATSSGGSADAGGGSSNGGAGEEEDREGAAG